VGHYDLLFAKAKWALALDGRPAVLNEDGIVDLRGARHPFLPGKAVPLNVAVGGDYRTLLITGPNTGGKTATIKTVGLLALMTQTGLLIPAEEGSRLPVFRAVEADIGDDQSLDRSLSTFSSHLRNVTDILAEADRRTLVLLDELATGTDPGEGIGLSIAVLEELHRRRATVLATTHFNEIKEYARTTPGYRNARMAFDEETLRPLYRLDMGEAGDSYAFVIARKLGVSEAIVERAKTIASGLRGGRLEVGGGQAADVRPDPSAREPQAADSSRAGAPPAQAPRIESRRAEPSSVEPTHTEPTHAEPPRAVSPRVEPPQAESATVGSPEPGVGDQVWIPSLNARGVVFAPADERGELIVQVRGRKLRLNRKRVKLAIEARHLYPADYDLDIVFETVENRKKRKQMGKRHVEGLQIETPPEEP
jgi:dsDNA-specific endonuclease/ATPase MutS2